MSTPSFEPPCVGALSLRDAIDLYRSYNANGGRLHIVLEDGNVENENLDFCMKECLKEGDVLGIQIIEAMYTWCSPPERLALLGKNDT